MLSAFPILTVALPDWVSEVCQPGAVFPTVREEDGSGDRTCPHQRRPRDRRTIRSRRFRHGHRRGHRSRGQYGGFDPRRPGPRRNAGDRPRRPGPGVVRSRSSGHRTCQLDRTLRDVPRCRPLVRSEATRLRGEGRGCPPDRVRRRRQAFRLDRPPARARGIDVVQDVSRAEVTSGTRGVRMAGGTIYNGRGEE